MFDDVDFSALSEKDILTLLHILRDCRKDPSLLYELRERLTEEL
ncbi:conserved hypothetical protein (plasmid) [Thioalkalivibrio sp. K90mix]|nr:conserved hypothetical protein [Thioalkalivibrio sp. K90mix]